MMDASVAEHADERGSVDQSLTDLHLCARHPERSVCFPGPRQLPIELIDYSAALLQKCQDFMAENPKRADFAIEHHGNVWRARYEPKAVDGDWFRLRRQPRFAPHLGPGGLPSPLPDAIVDVLLHEKLQAGGLVVVCGATGAGKTHTAYATARSRLQKFGGMCFGVEDPPEQPLNGWWEGPNGKRGYCTQTMVETSTDLVDGWAVSMEGVLRSQPAATPSMLFVGELRTPKAAAVALQAAGNGFLVITTGFATDMRAGIASLLNMVGVERASDLAYLLRVVVFQSLRELESRAGGTLKTLSAELCVSPHPASRVALIIRQPQQLSRIQEEVQRQQNYVKAGVDVWKTVEAGG